MIVQGLRITAGLILHVAMTSLTIYEHFRGMVQAVDRLANGFRDAYVVFRAFARETDPTRVRGIGGDIIPGLTVQMPLAIGQVSNLAGGLQDMTAVLRQVREAWERLNRTPSSFLISRQRAAGIMAHVINSAVRNIGFGGSGVLANAGLDEDSFDRLIHDLQRTGQQATMTAAAFHRWGLEQQGANAVQVTAADDLFRANQRLQMQMQLRTPGEAFTDRMAELRDTFTEVDAIARYNRAIDSTGMAWFRATNNVETYTRAQDQAIEQYLRAAGAMSDIQAPQLPAALSQNSTAAINFINQANREASRQHRADPRRHRGDAGD